jgi:hypothetical protein
VSVPAGADPFSKSSGTFFIYPVTNEGVYQYRCDFHFGDGMTGSFIASTASPVLEESSSSIPYEFHLNQNFPNPFNPATTISFDVPVLSHITLKVYGLTGAATAVIADRVMDGGRYSIHWNAGTLPSGIYFYRLQARPLSVKTERYVS